jgi:Raf kinase inhibitor-like YbhB/YbcL family protein
VALNAVQFPQVDAKHNETQTRLKTLLNTFLTSSCYLWGERTKDMPRKLISILFIIALLTGCVNAPAATAIVPPTNTTESITSPISQQQTSGFTLTSTDVADGGRLPIEYTCDGDGSTLPLTWSGAPDGTQSYAVIMHHVAAPDEIHWYWVLYNIPAEMTSLPKNVSGIGTLGNNINNGLVEYSPPCSQGPGDKEYIYTVYALSAQPQITVAAEEVNRAVMLDAIKDITLASAELHTIYARQGMEDPQAQSSSNQQQGGGGTPPEEAIAACNGQAENAPCMFNDKNGSHTGVCKTQQETLACAPDRDGQGDVQQGQGGNNQPTDGAPAYNIEQAISDKAQGMTISYDALAFMTGDLGADSFFPPGKVADFWGFQYLRDNDPSEMGHAGDFLTSAAMNTLNNLSADQRAKLVALAQSQVAAINEYGYKRFVLIKAFDRLLTNDLPAGTTGLNEEAVKAYSAELYKLDGQISFERAQLMGKIINSLSADQKAYFDAMVGQGMKEWNTVEEPEDIRGLDRDVKVAVMTYAADLYSWYAGSVEADVYFCPERHGTYFGSFYLKDIKAMSDPTYSIPTNLTGDLGEVMLGKLTSEQSRLITSLVDVQKPSLQGIVDSREQISLELRKFKDGGAADQATVLALMEQYGAYDGEIIYNMAVNFAAVKNSLTAEQQTELDAIRTELLGDQSHPTGAYLYSQAVSMPEIPNTDFLFK